MPYGSILQTGTHLHEPTCITMQQVQAAYSMYVFTLPKLFFLHMKNHRYILFTNEKHRYIPVILEGLASDLRHELSSTPLSTYWCVLDHYPARNGDHQGIYLQ